MALSPLEPQPSLEGLDSLESDHMMPSLESLDLSFRGAGASFDEHFGRVPQMTTEKVPSMRTRAVSTTSGPNLNAKLGTPPTVGSRSLGALQPKVLTLPLSPSLDNRGTTSGGVGRVKAMQREKRQRKSVQADPQSALMVAAIRRSTKTPDLVAAVHPAPEPTQPHVVTTTPPMSSPQDYDNSAVSLVEGWEIYAVSDTRCQTPGSADGKSPRADYSPLAFGSRDGSFSGGGRSQSSAILSSRPPSMREGSQVSETLAGYPAAFSAPQGLPTTLPRRKDQRRAAHKPSFLGAAKTSTPSNAVNTPNKVGVVARRRRRRTSGSPAEQFYDGGKGAAPGDDASKEVGGAADDDKADKVGPRGRFAGGSGKGTSAGTPGTGRGGAVTVPTAGVALGRGGVLQPGDFVADPPCSAPLAASFLALGGGSGSGNEGRGAYKKNRSNSSGMGVHSSSAPATQQQQQRRQRRQRTPPGRASAPVEDGSAASNQDGAFFLTGVDGFEAVTPDGAAADDAYTNASGTSATGVTSAPSLLPPWRRPAYPQLREGSATAAALTAANRHFVDNQRTFVDCDGRHKTYQAELTLLKSEQQQLPWPTKSSGFSPGSNKSPSVGSRYRNDGANLLLRLAGSASDHGGGPRSTAPGQASTYSGSVGSLQALPPPGVHHHPLHATHTALRGSVDREQRLVVSEGYVRSTVWKSTLRELGTVPSRLPA